MKHANKQRKISIPDRKPIRSYTSLIAILALLGGILLAGLLTIPKAQAENSEVSKTSIPPLVGSNAVTSEMLIEDKQVNQNEMMVKAIEEKGRQVAQAARNADSDLIENSSDLGQVEIDSNLNESSDDIVNYEERYVEETYYEPSYEESYSEDPYEHSYESSPPSDFYTQGVIYDDYGTRYTWYSESVLPGGGLYELNNNGRHVDENGYIRDGEGYLAVASNDYPQGSVIETPFGTAKVYDSGCASGTIDMYVSW